MSNQTVSLEIVFQVFQRHINQIMFFFIQLMVSGLLIKSMMLLAFTEINQSQVHLSTLFIIIMSLIIDESSNYFTLWNSPSLQSPQEQILTTGNRKIKVAQYLTKCLGNLSTTIFDVYEGKDLLTLRLKFINIYKELSTILNVTIDFKEKHAVIEIRCFGQNDQYLKIQGRDRIIMFCKWVSTRVYQHMSSQFSISINMVNGEIKIKSPFLFNLYKQKDLQLLALYIKKIRQRTHDIVKQFYFLLDMTAEIRESHHISFYTLQKIKLSKQNFGKYYWHNSLINIKLYICSESTHEADYVQREIIKQNESTQKIKANYVSKGQQISSLQSYVIWNHNIMNSSEIFYLRTHSFDKVEIKSRIEMPSLPKLKNKNQNNYVLNYIKSKKTLDRYPRKKLCQGGLTNLTVTEIQFWYVSSSNVGCEKMLEQIQGLDPFKKLLVMKSWNQKLSPLGIKNRVTHEKKILTKMKNGLSMFLPQYYLLAQKDNGNQKNLFMDYIEYPNLLDYCLKNKQTFSFHTKIYFSVLIAQALRYISEYNVNHLDLKPTNIMLNRRLGLKLIDFGESYHPSISDHQPGFTMPYSAPENYQNCKSFSYKNDIFSLGVIMHQLFLGKYPFFFHDLSRQQKIYKDGNFSNYWFNVPQGNALYGESIVFPLIESIIGKCLHADPQHRPQLEWIVYILRGCLDYFY